MAFEIRDENVSLVPGEEDRIKDALLLLSKDHHAPREISVRLTLSMHHEYPKLLYKSEKTQLVQNEAEEDAASADGFGAYEVPVVEEAPAAPGPALVAKVPEAPAPAAQPEAQPSIANSAAGGLSPVPESAQS